MELTGVITTILPTKSGVSQRSGNTWMSQDFVLEVPGEHVTHCCFRIFGEDRIKQCNIRLNETVTVHFSIDAHEYKGRWYNEMQAYNVTAPNQQATVQEASASSQTPFQPQDPSALPY